MAPMEPNSFASSVSALIGRDAQLAALVESFGVPEEWTRPAGFGTLVRLILEQQVSLASADAAYRRLELRVGRVTPASVRQAHDDELRADGFSRQKIRYVRALSEAIASGTLDLIGLAKLDDATARDRLIALPGIGPWTADVYLLACLGHPDVWPIGDRALQVSASEVLGLAAIPDAAGLAEIGERWRPFRAAAAQLLWHAYLGRRRR